MKLLFGELSPLADGSALPARMAEGNGRAWYVDSTNGNDTTGNGSRATPYRTIQQAQNGSPLIAAGDYIYLRSHQAQIYYPPGGRAVLSGIIFQENYDPGNQPTRVQFLAGGSLTVTVADRLVLITYVTGVTLRSAVITAFNAAVNWCVASLSAGDGAISADVVMTFLKTSSAYTNGANDIQGVTSNALYVSGAVGNPITVETDPQDLAAGFGQAAARARRNGPLHTPKQVANGTINGTNLATTNGTAAAPVVTSATHNFVAADVGFPIRITAGVNWTTGYYRIVSVAANAATLDRACGTAASLTAGTWSITDVGKAWSDISGTFGVAGTQGVTVTNGANYPSAGVVQIAGLAGTYMYTAKNGNLLTGFVTGGNAAPTGTISAAAVVTLQEGGGGNQNAYAGYGILVSTQSNIRVRNLKIDWSFGDRGVGLYFASNTPTTNYEAYGCEFTSNWYQNLNVDPGNPPDNLQIRNCWFHDSGTGQQSAPSDASTNPSAQQHGIYVEGTNVWVINCKISDIPYGYGIQMFQTSGTGSNAVVAHCTVVRCGQGQVSGAAVGNVVVASFTNVTLKNNVFYDPNHFCVRASATNPTNVAAGNNLLAIQGAVVANSLDYFADQGGFSSTSWLTETNNVRVTADPGFVNYATRDLRPVGNFGPAPDLTYTPAKDFNGKVRRRGTVGCFEF